MSNLFKSNSRFAALVEDEPKAFKKDNGDRNKGLFSESNNKEEYVNLFKNETKYDNDFNSFKERNKDHKFRQYDGIESQKSREKRLEEENTRKIREKLEKDRLEQESLKIDNFPVFTNNYPKKNTENLKKMNYLEKMRQTDNIEDKNNSLDPDIANLKPGWVLLKKDPQTGNTIIKSHPSAPFPEKEKPKKTDLQIGRDILKALVDLHEKRTKEYIDTYGEHAWEKMFKRPRWREEEAEYDTDSDDDDSYEEYEEDNDEY